MKFVCVVLLLTTSFQGNAKRSKLALPVRSPATSLDQSERACSSTDGEIQKTKNNLLTKFWFRPCDCGGPGWERVAYYNFSQQECPPGFSRLSGRWKDLSCQSNDKNEDNGCRWSYRTSSLALPVEGRSYSRVCGRIIGHGWRRAFENFISCDTSLEGHYVSGVSLTHGPPGNRSHIWTFAAAFADGTEKYTKYNCPCSHTNRSWIHILPDYIGQDYFCDSDRENTADNKYVRDKDDPLWDGQGCGPTSSCCEFNHPPYFCKHLLYSTSEDLEMRLFSSFYRSNAPYFPTVSLIEIYIK